MKRLLRLSFFLVLVTFLFSNISYGSSIIKYLEQNTMMASSEESSGVPAPPAPSQTQYCGYTKLTRSTPPSGTVYYWQTSSTGTSTSNSSSAHNVYNNGYVYLRALNGTTWSSATSIYVNVKQTIDNPTVNTSVSRCGSGTVSMAATPPTNAYIKWYQGSTYKSSNETYSPTISTTTTYTVKSYQNGCYSSGVNVTATVKARPSIPTASNNSRCGAGTVALTATPPSGATVKWYEGTTVRATGNNYSPSISSTKTYTVKAVKDGCYSGGRDVTATIKELPYLSVTQTSNARCGTGNIDLNTSPSPSTATVVWEYENGGTFYTGNTYTANLTSEGDDVTYKVYASLNGCNSTKGTISATSKPIPANPTASNESRCGTGTLALSATPPSGSTVKWYQGTTYKASGNSYTTPSISSTTTYTAKSVLDGCYSSGKSVVATVKAIPAIPTASNKSRCGNGTVALTATPPSGATVKWYAAGVYKATGNTYTTPSITNNTTYTAKSEKDGCISSAKSVTAIVNAQPANPTPTNNSICGTGKVTLSATPPSGSTVEWSEGGAFKASGNSFLTPTLSTSKTYTAKSYNTECYSTGVSVTATIKPVPDDPTAVDNSRCGSGTVELSATPPSGATIEWFEGGNSKATGNSYTTQTLTSNRTYIAKSVKDGCPSTGVNVTAIIKEIPYMVLTTNQEFCGLGTHNITVTPTPSSATIVWMKGNSTIYTGNTKPVEFTDYDDAEAYNVYANLNGCNSGTASINATVKVKPTSPTVSDANRVEPGVVSLSASSVTPSTSTINWINTSTSLTDHTGSSYAPDLNVTTTYNVVSHYEGCDGDPVSVTAEIIPLNITNTSYTNGDDYLLQDTYTPAGENNTYDNFNVDGTGGSFNINLFSNAPWSLEDIPEWVEISPEHQSGNAPTSGITHTIPVSYNSNFNADERIESLNVVAAGKTVPIYFSQSSPTLDITIDPSSYVSLEATNFRGADATAYTLNATDGIVSYTINTDVPWTLQIEDDFSVIDHIRETSGITGVTSNFSHGANFANNKLAIFRLQHEGKPIKTLCFRKEAVAFFESASELNSVQTTSYGEHGRVMSQGIQYYDRLGKPTQSIVRNIHANNIIASQTIYDDHGRAWINTLPSVVNQQSLDYINDFVNMDYLNANNEMDPYSPAGIYYSAYNSIEDFVPEDSKPFTKVEYSETFPGATRKAYMPGEVTSDKFSTGFTVSASPDELLNHPLYKQKDISLLTLEQVSEGADDNHPLYLNLSKSVSVDVMGNEIVTYFDAEGRTIANCMSSISPDFTDIASYTINMEDGNDYIDIHLPTGPATYTLTKVGAWEHMARNLLTDDLVDDDGNAANIVLGPGFYRIISLTDNQSGQSFHTSLGYKYYSFSTYDDAGRLIRTISPEHVKQISNNQLSASDIDNLVTRNTYNVLGWLLESFSPDEGTTKYIYRKDGKLLYSQNELQREENNFSYTNYDEHGRPVEMGEYEESTSGGLHFETLQTVPGLLMRTYTPGEGLNGSPERCIDSTITIYGENDDFLPREQRFTRGRVSKTQNRNTTTWYSYNYDGSVAWILQEIDGLNLYDNGTGNDVSTPGIEDVDDLITIDYTYDFSGNVTDVVYQKWKPDEFTHFYEYDLDNRLKTVYTKDNGGEKMLQARYEYYAHGPLKRVELAEDVQGIDYIYNIHGWLKSINNPNGADPGYDGMNEHYEIATDIFKMAIDYYENDYASGDINVGNAESGMGNYDGNIAQIRYLNEKLDEALASGSQNAWQYTYDERNFLAEATFGSVPLGNSFTTATNHAYSVFGSTPGTPITYDANGNIKNLARNNGAGTLMDQFTYHYKTDFINRLAWVEDGSGYTDTETGDLKSHTSSTNYVYNKIGQLVHDKTGKNGDEHEFIYDVYGKVTKVRDKNGVVADYQYNDAGFRVKKKNYQDNTTTWYVRDASGSILATYETINNATELAEVQLYASGRIGMAKASGGTIVQYQYELTDHLGNVRATIAKNGNDVDILTSTDYYPFGMEMPGRDYRSAEAYRFGYQGQFAEKDEETGYNSFELRLYDNRLGRWLSTDPMYEFYSPYLANGNNPINIIDPTGGIGRPWFENRLTGELLYLDDDVYEEQGHPGTQWTILGEGDNYYFGEEAYLKASLMLCLDYDDIKTFDWIDDGMVYFSAKQANEFLSEFGYTFVPFRYYKLKGLQHNGYPILNSGAAASHENISNTIVVTYGQYLSKNTTTLHNSKMLDWGNEVMGYSDISVHTLWYLGWGNNDLRNLFNFGGKVYDYRYNQKSTNTKNTIFYGWDEVPAGYNKRLERWRGKY
jgi:RHS repeat-associated protein